MPNQEPPVPLPIFPELLVERIFERIPLGQRAIGVVDGADAAEPVEFACRIRERIRTTGRACDVIDVHDFVKPASLRFEYSRTDELSYRSSWFDFDALRREVVAPMANGGRGRYLPRLWDEAADRSARAALVTATPDHVLLIAGPTLIGRIEATVTVHLKLSNGALRRRTPDDQQWTVAPIAQFYADAPDEPDFTVRWDHPAKPAILPRR